MALDYSGMFRNKLVDPGEYMARVVAVRTERLKNGRDAIEVELRLDHNESKHDGTRLIVILQPTDKGQRFVDAFHESYRINESTLQQAIGRWASVYIYESLYKGTAFGAVKFHLQPAAARAKAAELEGLPLRRPAVMALATTNGLLEWDEVADVPSAN